MILRIESAEKAGMGLGTFMAGFSPNVESVPNLPINVPDSMELDCLDLVRTCRESARDRRIRYRSMGIIVHGEIRSVFYSKGKYKPQAGAQAPYIKLRFARGPHIPVDRHYINRPFVAGRPG